MDCRSAFDQALSSFRAEANKEECITNCGHVAKAGSKAKTAHQTSILPNYWADATTGTV
jgi:hypothetical protein